MRPPGASFSRPASTLEADQCQVDIQGTRAGVHTSISVSEADTLIRLASVLADDAQTATLFAFVMNQVNGQHVRRVSAAAVSPSGYADEISRRITVFALGLVFIDQDIKCAVSDALTHGYSSVSLRLDAGTVFVCLETRRMPPRTWRVTVPSTDGHLALH
ncbi:hypothetical protein QT383_04765 [Stenotrophomonas rhizophila]